jgi:ABC-type antimicrobial peptide transport system permease subunit
MIGVLVYAFIHYKKQNEGFLSLSEALKIGLGISLISALFGVIYSLILTNVLDPNTINKTIDFAFEKMRSENHEMTKDQIDMARGIAEKMSTPLISSAVQIIGALFIGFIVSLIGGLIVKKSRPE